MAKINKTNTRARNTNVQAGIDKHVGAPITLGGAAFTPADLKSVFQAHSAAMDTADALHKQWQDQLLVVDDAGDKAAAVYGNLQSFIIGQYGKSANAVLNDFGMQARKASGPKTLGTKTVAAEKRAATRAARHTMGTRQKQTVRGDVTGVVMTPITATTSVAAPPSPTAPAVSAAPASKPNG